MSAVLLVLAALLISLMAAVWLTTHHPRPLQPEPVVCAADAPFLRPGQTLKVMSWNVQYMAGKKYFFYYDALDEPGPDERPSPENVAATLREVARIIGDEDPDIILLQEVDDGAKRTDHRDQLADLLPLISDAYRCHASAFYWKASFVPHPRILGAVGMKLCTGSKFRIARALRHQLALIPEDPISRQFNLKRAILECRLPVEGGGELVVLNTHLDAFAQGTDIMERQVRYVEGLLEKLTADRIPWLIGGDFNLLPPGRAYSNLTRLEQAYYKEETELATLFNRYRAVPSLAEVNGEEPERWFTYFSNDPRVTEPDRTIDYIFLSGRLTLGEHSVRQHDTLEMSDHLPVLATFRLS